ncbi:MAG: carbohydrate binding domain-containing protein [Armatimonadota bacterium]
MRLLGICPLAAISLLLVVAPAGAPQRQSSTVLPGGVKAVWDLGKAYHETTPTRERICINGLWRWQPAEGRMASVPADAWGYLKVPGPWPGTRFWMHRESQAVHKHPQWEDADLSNVDMAWYQREFTIPADWAARRISVTLEYLNSYAAVYVDDTRAGEVYFPGGEVEITGLCRPGSRQLLSLYTVALPLNEEIVSYADAEGASRAKGRVLRRGLCGDVFLVSAPSGPRIDDIKVDTSVRNWEITFDAALQDLDAGLRYALKACIFDNQRVVCEFDSQAFQAETLETGRFAFTQKWKPDKLWDVHTPDNTYELILSLLDAEGDVLDEYWTLPFGFRELWIDGRDFLLNGTRIFLFAVPLDNAQIGPTAACYDGARESLQRLKSLGVNMMYNHNYDCLPGSHLGFTEILRAADDVGMLISFSMPHAKDYDWKAPDADAANGYARHAEFYVRRAQNHPSVVMYSMNHNMTGYSQDMNPDRIDGLYNPWPDPSGKSDVRTDRSATLARRAEVIVRRLDPTRITYHHSSGNLGQLHTSNFYLNFVPIQERSDWFRHWADEGVKPVFLCEYGVPLRMSWTQHRGWYKGERSWTNGKLPHQFCTAEWGAQFLGDRAYRLTEGEKADLRFEAQQWRKGATWYRWDYPFQVINTPALGVPNIDDVQAMYITDNWRAFRTWGVPAFNIWTLSNRWKLRERVDTSRKTLDVDWENLQRPGFSPDFIDQRYERFDTAYEVSDWLPTEAAKALIRSNQPLLAYIAGKPTRFTSKDHNYQPGERLEKQIVVINNSRETVRCKCTWSLDLPRAATGSRQVVVETGQQERIPLRFQLPATLAPGAYSLSMTTAFSSGETQQDTLTIHLLPRSRRPKPEGNAALFDPRGETANTLEALGVECDPINADADLAPYATLIVGKGALTVDGPAPDISRVGDGLRVLVFEQQADVLEKRLGFRVQEYGLRRVFRRIPDHPLLDGLDAENLRDWRGEATLVPPRVDPGQDPNTYPSTRWCGIKVSRAWRAGCYGNVASVLIEKPAAGDFLPIVDGGFGLQYSPLMVFGQGAGMILFCQMDVTGRTEDDPAARRLLTNMLEYVGSYSPPKRRTALYVGDPAGRAHLERSGLAPAEYNGGALTTHQVLIVGAGGGSTLAAHKGAISEWLEAGGHMLAVGVDEREANAFLPFRIHTEGREHINAYFEPPGVESLLAGIGPADVLNRDPRRLPLVTAGAEVVGNGVLAVAPRLNVVFCQFAPWEFNYEKLFHRKMTFRRTSFLLTRVLANMGVSSVTPLLSRFSAPVASPDATDSVISNGDFRLDADGDGVADGWQFQPSAERASCTLERLEQDGDRRSQRLALEGFGGKEEGSVMLAQHDVPLQEGQWYRISLRAKAEGLRGARVNLTVMNTENWRSFFEYQRFAPDEKWREFAFEVESSGAADSNTRFQIWYGSVGTLWLSDVRMVPIAPPRQGRWLAGLYLDEPEEMDDPYRFFRW